MRSILVAASLIGASWSGAALAASSSSSSSSSGGSTAAATGSDHCDVVHKPASARPGGALTSSVTAGPNGVSGATSGGSGVHVEAGDGRASSSAGLGGQTVTTSSDGHCTITIYDKD